MSLSEDTPVEVFPQENLLAAATRVAIIATDLQGRITTWNSGAEHMLGYTASEMVGKHNRALLHVHLETELATRSDARSAELGEPINGFEVLVAHARRGGYDERDWTYVRKDGTQLNVRLAITAVRDGAGAIVGFLGTAVDMTERRRTEETLSASARTEDALRRSEANLHAMLANTTDIIAYYDRSRRLVAFNQACAEAFRRMLGTDLAPGCRVADLVPEAMREYWNANSERVLRGEAFAIELEMPVPGDGQRVLEASYHPIRQGADIVGFMTTTRDVTQRKRAENELREREKQFKTLFECAPYACAVVDLEGRYLMINRAFGPEWGLTTDAVLGRTAEEIGIDPEVGTLDSPSFTPMTLKWSIAPTRRPWRSRGTSSGSSIA